MAPTLPSATKQIDGEEQRLEAPPRDIQELWFSIARRAWNSVVLVPADAGESTAGVARALADVAKWLRQDPVTLILMSDPLDYACATQLVGPVGQPVNTSPRNSGPVIVAVQPVTVEPLGLAVTQSADAVILCIQMGHTRMSAARRTIDLVGRDRVSGAFLAHPDAVAMHALLAHR